MERQVATYLFKNKSCFLPGVGLLKVMQQPARYIGIDQKIEPPFPYIRFTSEEMNSDFPEYLAGKNKISLRSAEIHQQSFCERLKNLSVEEAVEIPAAGQFTVDNTGKLIFRQRELDPQILPVAEARTVVRTSEHAILVGDVESNSSRMAAYYSETTESKKAFWKIWAALLFLLACGLTAYNYYYLGNKGTGNTQNFPVSEPAPTYKVPQP